MSCCGIEGTLTKGVDWAARLLHFEAVDWETKVFINNHFVGEYVGGYLPFCVDITDYLAEDDKQNELVVRVWIRRMPIGSSVASRYWKRIHLVYGYIRYLA